MKAWRWALWLVPVAACTLGEPVSEGACVEAHGATQVCYDGLVPCGGATLDGSCEAGGYTVAVEACDALIAGTEGGFVEPGLCPSS